MDKDIKIYRYSFGSIDNESNLLPNNNVLYGPYESIDKAYDTIYNALGNDIPIGLTIGIKINDKITEYWFNEGINKYNLVAKNKTSSDESIDVTPLFTVGGRIPGVTMEHLGAQPLYTMVNSIEIPVTFVPVSESSTNTAPNAIGNNIGILRYRYYNTNNGLWYIALSQLSGGSSVFCVNVAFVEEMSNKQEKLISGVTIKTINGNSILGGGDLKISADTSEIEIRVKDIEENYSKKINTIRHFSFSPIASANGLSLLLEGEYDDSVQGNHLFGPHNIILPYATESKAGVMSPEDKKVLTQSVGLIDLGDMSPAEIISKLEDDTIGIFLVRDNTSSSADIRYTIYKTFVPRGEYSFFATKLEWKGDELVNTVGTFGGDKNGHGGFVIEEKGVTEEYVNNAIAEAITTTLNTEV